MARDYTNEEIREDEKLMEEFGDERADIAEEIKKMRKYKGSDNEIKKAEGIDPLKQFGEKRF